MSENCYEHPCGFCGGELSRQTVSCYPQKERPRKCLGCGVWWSHRNFHFAGANLGRKSRGPEFFLTWDKYPAGTHIWRTEWNGYDEDDSQAVEAYAAEYEGYFLGERFHRSVPHEVGDDESVWKELAEQVTVEAAPVTAVQVPEGQESLGVPG